ncbi:MAG: hypothetical protein AMS26_01210 [Bacteroides sp. SM23_62]|nr:MAG: hypothetical protein AMS26_01210 [Bacteroides sp. SM23_62]
MDVYDLCIATDWFCDKNFVQCLEQIAQKQGLTTYVVYPYNVNETINLVQNDLLKFTIFYDRASDSSVQFVPLYNLLSDKKTTIFQRLSLQQRASDKALMHELFVRDNINTPKTIIVPEYFNHPVIDIDRYEFAKLGRPFIIKPSLNTGAGLGVYTDGFSIEYVMNKRQEFPDDKYLIQEKVIPKEIDNRSFWFRVFYVCGEVHTTWWDNYTHRYEEISNEAIEKYRLNYLFSIMKKIYNICRLNFFSTEFALDTKGRFVAIDYVNEICDMRLQSEHYDGVPDELVQKISKNIVSYVVQKLNK